MLKQTPGGKSYDAVFVLGAALDQMIKDGFNVKEASLGFDFGSKLTSSPWAPGKRLMEYIKNVSITGRSSTKSNVLNATELLKPSPPTLHLNCS